MKKLRKLLVIAVVLLLPVVLCGCGNVKGELPDIMEKLYSGILEEDKPMMLENKEVTSDNIEYYLGTADIEYEEALASESGTGSIAHSVVLVRVKKGVDVEEVKEKIKKNVNPRKWICVGVEDDDVIVESKGDLVVLILVEDEKNREKIEDNFENLK